MDLISITALALGIATLAMPTLQRARTLGSRLECVRNLHQLGRAVQIYEADHDNRLPGCQHALPSWTEALVPYCNREIYHCPSRRETQRETPSSATVALNDFLTPHPHGARNLNYSCASSVPVGEETILFAEAEPEYLRQKYDHFHFADRAESGYMPERFRTQVNVTSHAGGANYLMVDGHVAQRTWPEAQSALLARGSRFVHPGGKSAADYEAGR
ncbi:MAG TPA: H-X9-DG-CTERM domain-containing protein [Verrucomicrobiae bacterium]|nr:H-X9-DG-CTERM domain-containing protein [Verrucomicrobiae bacterium]